MYKNNIFVSISNIIEKKVSTSKRSCLKQRDSLIPILDIDTDTSTGYWHRYQCQVSVRIPMSGIGTDSRVVHSTRTCKI